MNGDIEVSSEVVADSSKQVTSTPPEKPLAPLEDMHSLLAQLPHKREGLSKHYSGKSKSFHCLLDVKRVQDIPKP
ncbi:hypothetical protein LWI28_009492 [Acer negundo]|uniref:Uncharacterized protein n=1 Tax=Acer negundo TaxID=4023 RepID=A0AAD5NF43_ACENE|nr:hypothetical protein LWI28_009492 [Acer negundo]KAK4834524.1 hypothetical protein QYF36_024236 [Acer negundo]